MNAHSRKLISVPTRSTRFKILSPIRWNLSVVLRKSISVETFHFGFNGNELQQKYLFSHGISNANWNGLNHQFVWFRSTFRPNETISFPLLCVSLRITLNPMLNKFCSSCCAVDTFCNCICAWMRMFKCLQVF